MRTTKKLTEIVSEWINSLDVLPSTRRDYQTRLAPWFRYLSAQRRDPRSARRADVLKYKQYLIDQKLRVNTVNYHLCMVRLFYGWCEDRRYCENIAVGIKAVKSFGDYAKYPLSTEQATKLIDSLDETKPIELRDKLMIGLMLFNGLRTCEVERVDLGDFDTMDGEPILRIQRKGRVEKGEIVVLHSGVVRWFELYIADRDSIDLADPLFVSHHPSKSNRLTRQSISHIVKRRMRDVAINDAKLTPHSLRHTYGTMLIEGGSDIETVRDLMGHTDTRTTRIYVGMAQKRRLLKHSPGKNIYDKIVGKT